MFMFIYQQIWLFSACLNYEVPFRLNDIFLLYISSTSFINGFFKFLNYGATVRQTSRALR